MVFASRESPVKHIRNFGQDVWLDNIDHGLIHGGGLEKLMQVDGVSGVTSNPTIFEKAFASGEYDDRVRQMQSQGIDPHEIYRQITADEIRSAADMFMEIFRSSRGSRGLVSLEVSPHLAYDTAGTIAEAREIWRLVDRPNLLVKIPGTLEGIPAIRQCVSEGINVNVTLLFGLPRYLRVAQAHIEGLKDRARRGEDLHNVFSVASFFISRIDTLVDPMLERTSLGGPGSDQAKSLHGMVGTFCAKAAYEMYQEIFASEKFHELAKRGAHPQRLVWASTGTKNPTYSDIKYVEPLIGPDTINTMPLATLAAYRDHGQPESRLEQNPDRPKRLLSHLEDMGIRLDEISARLEKEGVEKFTAPYDASIDRLTRLAKAA